MAINLKQTGRTIDSVTFTNIGITDNRQTNIWIPSIQQWYGLSDAKFSGYIKEYTATDTFNGSITVTFYPSNIVEYKVWEFQVFNRVGETTTAESSILDTLLYFEWEGTTTKATNNNIDITINDMYSLNKFSTYMKYWIQGIYTNDICKVDSIYASDLVMIAEKIYDTASYLNASKLYNKFTIMGKLLTIMSLAKSGRDCYAYFYNDLKWSINNFNLSV